MEQKVKLIIIGLIGFLVIALLLAGQLYMAKGKLENNIKELTDANDSLKQGLDNANQERERLAQNINSLQAERDSISQARDELQRRIDMLAREKEGLMAKIKAQKEAVAQQPQMMPQVSSTVANDAYWASILKSNADLQLKIEDIRNELKNLQIKNEELQRNKNLADLEMANLTREKKELQSQLEYNQKMIDNVTSQLVNERNDKFKMQDTLKTIKSENSSLRRQLETLNTRKIDLEKKLQEIKESKDGLERDFNNMQTLLKGKADEICRLKDQLGQADKPAAGASDDNGSVNLPPIVVRPQGQPEELTASQPSSSNLAGKVLAVNKQDKFVIIDLGEGTGIKLGDNLRVYRDNKDIGTVVVVQVRKDISACDIKTQNLPIKIGDRVQ